MKSNVRLDFYVELRVGLRLIREKKQTNIAWVCKWTCYGYIECINVTKITRTTIKNNYLIRIYLGLGKYFVRPASGDRPLCLIKGLGFLPIIKNSSFKAFILQIGRNFFFTSLSLFIVRFSSNKKNECVSNSFKTHCRITTKDVCMYVHLQQIPD